MPDSPADLLKTGRTYRLIGMFHFQKYLYAYLFNIGRNASNNNISTSHLSVSLSDISQQCIVYTEKKKKEKDYENCQQKIVSTYVHILPEVIRCVSL